MLGELFDTISIPGFWDLFEIILIAIILYQLILFIKGTRGWQMILGMTTLLLLYYLSKWFELRTIEWLLSNLFAYFVFALIVIFQAEIRRGLAQLGKGGLLGGLSAHTDEDVIEEIGSAVSSLASQKIGALIILEGEIGLRNYIESGIELDSRVSASLLVSIFSPSVPLHDGAIIIKESRIAAAGCFLPLTKNPMLSKSLGTRHRAAIGITEETDAIAVVVSEETGTISVVTGGKMLRGLSGDNLVTTLQNATEYSSSQAGKKPLLNGFLDKYIGALSRRS